MIRSADIVRVAKQQSLPLWLAQAIAAEVVFKEQFRRHRERFPQRERRSNQLALLGYLIERGEKR